MKNAIFLLLVLSAVLCGFVYYSTADKTGSPDIINNTFTSSPEGFYNTYYIGVMNNGNVTAEYFSDYDDLGLNIYHCYSRWCSDINNGWVNWVPADVLNATDDEYVDDIRTDVLGFAHTNGMRVLMDRVKINYMAYGQRSDYQCDSIDESDDLWFYAYERGYTGRDISDNGRTVRYCTQTNGGANWVVHDLRADREQVNCVGFSHAYEKDNIHNWYIKPKMRADVNYIMSHSDEPVCRLDVINMDNTLIKSVEIRARNFKDQSNQYDGSYKDEFRFINNDSNLFIPESQAPNFNPTCKGLGENSYVDFRIWWYGNCDMWFDYVRVENEPAKRLFSGEFDNTWLEWEVGGISMADANNTTLKFYIEEFEFNNLPCMAYVARKIRELSDGKYNLMCDLNWGEFCCHAPYWGEHWDDFDNAFINRYLIDSMQSDEIFTFAYPFGAYIEGAPEESDSWGRPYTLENYVPETLPVSGYSSENGRFSIPASTADYDEWLQNWFDYKTGTTAEPYNDFFTYWMKRADVISKENELPFVNLVQTHLTYAPRGYAGREPTNEEIEVMVNLSVTYGARAQLYYEYNAWGGFPLIDLEHSYLARSVVNPTPPVDGCQTHDHPVVPRDENVYGQTGKFQKIADINAKLKIWGPTLMSFNNDDRHSYIYRLADERWELVNNSYFSDIFTYHPSTQSYNCNEDFPEGQANPTGLTGECKGARYVQVATFRNTNEPFSTKYFMIVNRRCSPFINEQSYDNNGGRRLIKARFSNYTHQLDGYNNWNIYDMKNNQLVAQFSLTGNQMVQFGTGGQEWFMPGEGRLFKMVPTMRSGGTLVADESITGQSFTCEDTVINNGYNITFNSNGNTISFSDSATIIMNGGTFRSGTDSAGPTTNKNTFKAAVTGHKWNGLRFNGSTVKIYNSEFKDISSPPAGGGNYAVKSIDCPLNDIRYNIFTSSTDTAGGVNISYVYTMQPTVSAYIMYNTFTMNSSFARAVQVQSFAGLTAGVYVKANTMTSGGNATGVFLSTVTGGVVKNNSISGFSAGVNTVLSSVNLYGNTISNTSAISKGILGTSSSSISMVPSGGTWIGGFNNITNTSGNSKNIDVSSSIFFLDGGKNTFDISSSGTPYHLYGSMWDDGGSHTEQENNCFKLAGTQLDAPNSPNNSVTDGTNPITFDFIDYTCGASPPSGTTVVDIGNGLYDTIPTSSGGAGGSYSSWAYVVTARQLYDSLNVQLARRNYNSAEELCYELIDDYSNSTEATASLQTLFMTSTGTDTSSTSVSALKTYYENLILNNGSNIALVKISNYLVQKCKVLLRQYSSALAGFQQIINENQYNYEGLLARWDYMATSLLIQGQGGAFRGDNEDGDDDKSKLTKEQRKAFRETISTINEKNRNYNEARVKTLEEKTKNGDGDAEKELKVMKTLKDVVKSERPKDIFEHIRIVNNDIQKVFGSEVDNSPNSNNNNIPAVFRLSQNYPNPFNPVTKIIYDLPRDSKVTLTIYDILGREVKRLVNSEIKPAGSYIVEFNAVNYASGVYFYRIEAEELNGSKHIDAKKMVLVK